jgi:Putative serine esterase (DUF676)
LHSCVSISGLASHPFGSWKQRESDVNFMWLRDRLPLDLKHVRSIIYGYDTKLHNSESFQNVEDIARALVARLNSTIQLFLPVRPIVFLTHSLGGIVLKSAIIQIAENGNMKDFIEAIVEVIFFGVPHLGMSMSHLCQMVRGQPNIALVNEIFPNSAYLSTLDEKFSAVALSHKMRLVSAYETTRSRTTQVNFQALISRLCLTWRQ